MSTQAEKAFCITVDIGGTKISAALISSEAQMFDKQKAVIDKSEPSAPVCQIVELIDLLQDAAGQREGTVHAVGIAVPGIVYHNSGKVWAPNIPGWHHFPLREQLEARSSLPLVLESDRSAYVLGEAWCGTARGSQNVVFLAVGTGIGAGIIVDGHLCHGYEDISGAVGWFALTPEFKPVYAEKGCFEAEASGHSLGQIAIREIQAGKASDMLKTVRGKIDAITAEIVIEAAKQHDPLARRIVDSAVQYLSMGIANIVSMLNPEIVVLGGGLFQAGEFLLKPIQKQFQKWTQPLAARKVKLVLSTLGEDAGLYGAGRSAWENLEVIHKSSGPVF